MENKKTSELLDLVQKEPESEEDWGEWEEVVAELEKRWPFSKILGGSEYSNIEDMTFEERLQETEADIKLLKRHKHDGKTGDVLIRI